MDSKNIISVAFQENLSSILSPVYGVLDYEVDGNGEGGGGGILEQARKQAYKEITLILTKENTLLKGKRQIL